MSLHELLGTELPLIQAPMAGSQGSALAIAVSNAGGLGSLPCALLSIEAMRTEAAAIKAGSGKPFLVNFFCYPTPVSNATREAGWRELLSPYYRQYGIDATNIPPGPARASFNNEYADAIEEFAPAVVSFHFGLPSTTLLARVRSWGSKILSSATTVEEARWLEERGVDGIIAQGLEAGGHRGHFLSHDLTAQLGTFALLPQTALTNLFTGRPARGIVNRVMRELGPMNDAAPEFPLAATAIAPLRARAEGRGSGDFSPLWSGQNASGCSEDSAAAVTQRLAGGL